MLNQHARTNDIVATNEQSIPLLVVSDQVPMNPQEMLVAAAKPQPSRRKWILLGAGGLFLAQIALPQPMKPSTMIGGIMADFYTPIMRASATNTIQLAQQQALAQRIAELEAARAEWVGNCALTSIISPELGQVCITLANERYESAVAAARETLGTN